MGGKSSSTCKPVPSQKHDGEPATTNKKRVTRRKEENESSMVVNLTLTMSILAGGNWCALKIALRKAALVRGITFLVLSEVQNYIRRIQQT